MFEIVKMIFAGIWILVRIPLYCLICVIVLFYILLGLHMLYLHVFKGERLNRGSHKRPKKSRLLVDLLHNIPLRYAKDIYSKEADFFPYQGVIMYTGRQGYGKSVALVHDMMCMQRAYPSCKVLTNLDYKYQDIPLKHWKQLIQYKNGIYGVIAAIDETQNWFSSNQSRNFPPKMLQVITQMRKNRRVILGTTQNFYQLAKPLRVQCTEVRECFTLLGCFTIVRKREPILDSEGNVREWKNRGVYWFVHTDDLRNAFDTYKVIESLAESGFHEDASINVENNFDVYVGK